MSDNLKRRTARALVWSLVQSWSIKIFSLLLFFVLARYLTSAEMGLAQTVTVLLAFVAVFSEQGFHTALVQRQGLRSVDVNLPFFLTTTVALVASTGMYVFAEQIAILLREPSAASLIRLAAVIPPLTAANGIAIAMLRRELEYKTIAKATFTANLTSGLIALFLVTQGWGPMALVLQAAMSGLTLSLHIWLRPGWKPTFRIDTTHFKNLAKFSSASFASQLIDFFSSRLVDIIILSRLGVAALGVYAVGAKLYLTLLELLATALMTVAMSTMSKLHSDKVRLKKTYLNFVFLGSCTTTPLFVAISALAPEICEILFGSKWKEATYIAHWLCLLGSVQVVQFFNGAALDALGKPRSTLLINTTKLTSGILVLTLYPANDIQELILAFVTAQLIVTPISFALALTATGTSFQELLSRISVGFTSSCIAYLVAILTRESLKTYQFNSYFLLIAISSTFMTAYIAAIYIIDRGNTAKELKNSLLSFKS